MWHKQSLMGQVIFDKVATTHKGIIQLCSSWPQLKDKEQSFLGFSGQLLAFLSIGNNNLGRLMVAWLDQVQQP